jgi:ABC-2 type transport system permease protein
MAAEAVSGAGLVDRSAETDSYRRTLGAVFRYRSLIRHLVAKDLKLKYRGSILGFIWSLLNPLVMLGVYTVAFKYIVGIKTPDFVLYLLLGILAWNFFNGSLMMATGAIIDNGGIVKSVFFPRAILPISTVLFNFAQYILTAIVYLPVMMLLYRVPLSVDMVAYPLFLLLQLLFTIGLALLISVGTSFFRDFRHFLEIALQALFWLTPIIYQLDIENHPMRRWLRFSPLSPYVIAYHQIFYDRVWPQRSAWALAFVYAAVALVLGLRVMLKHEDRLSEQI